MLNSIIQKEFFEAGAELIATLTRSHQGYRQGHTVYMGTPGVYDASTPDSPNRFDIKIKCAELENSLKYDAHYKIFFVVSLDGGRVSGPDALAINEVCQVIKAPFEYGLIVNKVYKKQEEEILNKGPETFTNLLDKKPSAIICLKSDRLMANDDKPFFSAQDENRIKLLGFINSLKSYRISPKDIGSFR